ncbi:MAG: hypothetical protein OXC28_06400, partial [Defluviicoccus sp.]|nr:hypothetical protein [Defluviicoccus sp.]
CRVRSSGVQQQEARPMQQSAAHVPDSAAWAAPDPPSDEAQQRAIAAAVWTDLLWLMPTGRTVTVTVRDGRVAVELGAPGAAPQVPAH